MLQKLEFMVALAREQHFGRAATSCGVAQPTLSLGIQQLEEALNVKLVKRSSRFQGFTPEGERVLIWARRMVNDARAMRQDISEFRNGLGAVIRIAAVPSAMPLVASLTAPIQARDPSVRFTLLTRPSAELLGLLEQRDIDMGVTYIDNEPIGDVLKVPLSREQYVLLTTLGGAYGDSDQITWAELAALPLCMLTRDLQNRRIIDNVLSTVGVEIIPMVEADSLVALTSHVSTGNWVSIVPRSVIEAIDMTGNLRAVRIVEPEVTRMIGLVVSERFPIQPPVLSLIQDARARARVQVPTFA
jgi:DNA-binding transcriptional LysR family regulator